MLPHEIVLQTLENSGKEAYLVGGCVRDLLLGRIPNDYDVTTNASPKEICAVFKSFCVIETGIKHGTVTVMVSGEPIEITTYRIDGKYSDKRHPDNIAFTGELIEDLKRRDFTVNAMAMSHDGRIVDEFGGKDDLQKKLIRCVGEPDQRFSEDALRILRALRFSSTLGFEIEENTKRSANKLSKELQFVSSERLFVEIKKLLSGDNAEQVIIENKKILSALIPELAPIYDYDQKNMHHDYPLHIHTAKTVSFCPRSPVLRLAALFHDLGKPQTRSFDENGCAHYYGHAKISAQAAEQILNRFKCDTAAKEDVVFLVSHHDLPPEDDKTLVLKRLNRYGERRYRMLIELRRADNAAQKESGFSCAPHEKCTALLDEIIKERRCFTLRDLNISGDDLIVLGVPRGKKIGIILDLLLNEVMEGKLINDRSALISRADEFLENSSK